MEHEISNKIKVLLLLNSNKQKIKSLNDCTTKIELFVFMIQSYIQNFKNIDLIVEQCYPCTEMKTTFKLKNINNFPKVDHIILLDESGLFRKDQTFISHLKTCAKTISTLCKHTKFYNGEDMMFTYCDLIYYPNIFYIKPPVDDFIYAPRKEDGVIYILLDKDPNSFILSQLYDLLSLNKGKNNIIFKIGIISTHTLQLIEIFTDQQSSDLTYNIQMQLSFNLYIDYVYELSKANIFFSSSIINDTYFLYELAMCNTLHVAEYGLLQNKIIDELSIHVYNDSADINWKEIFNKLSTYNIRQNLIHNNYTWNNALRCIFNKIGNIDQVSNHSDAAISLPPITIGCCLNIKNKNRPVVINLEELKDVVIEEPKPIPKKKAIMQSQLNMIHPDARF